MIKGCDMCKHPCEFATDQICIYVARDVNDYVLHNISGTDRLPKSMCDERGLTFRFINSPLLDLVYG